MLRNNFSPVKLRIRHSAEGQEIGEEEENIFAAGYWGQWSEAERSEAGPQ